MEVDPVWLKPTEERPKRRGLIGALRKETNLKCLILTCLIYGCVLAIVWCRVTRVTKVDIDFNAFPITSSRQISPCDDGYIYIPSAFVVMLYLLYLIECWHCKAWVQLRFEKTDVNRAYRIIQEMRQAQPLVWWKAVCYHYVRRTREIARIHNGDSYPATQVYYERVNSNLAGGCFFFGYCGVKDISSELVDLEKHAATKIRLSKGFLFANLAAAQEFEEQRSSFFQDQERFDDYMEMKEGLDLTSTIWSSDEFKENLISWASPDNLPWFARSTVFWFCNFLLLSWPLRLILELNTAHVHYQVNKLFGLNYVTPMSPINDFISAGSYTGRSQNQRRRVQNHHHHPQLQLQQYRRRHPATRRPSPASVSPLPAEEQSSETEPLLGDASRRSDSSTLKPEKDSSAPEEKDIYDDDGINSSGGGSSGYRNSSDISQDHHHHHHHHPHIGFPSYFQFRNSNRNPLLFFSRRSNTNPNLTGRSRIPRSVTLLMTKGEQREFSRFGFNYFDTVRQSHDDQYNDIGADINIGGSGGNIFQPEHSGHSSSINDSNNGSGGLAPTYSQALLLMEPITRQNSTSISSINIGNNDTHNTTNDTTQSHIQPGDDNHNGQMVVHYQHRNYNDNITTNGSTSSPSNNRSRNTNSSIRIYENNYNSGREDRTGSTNNTTGSTTTTASSLSVNARENSSINTVDQSRSRQQGLMTVRRTMRDSELEIRDEPLSRDSRREERAIRNGGENNEDSTSQLSTRGGSGNPPNFSWTAPPSHYPISDSANSIRSSSLVLNSVAPRGVAGVQIDLTQPVVMTVPNDPRSSGQSSGTNGKSTSKSSDNPPSYEEALRTSRPVFLPTLARIRRCFTERDIHSRLSSANFWLNDVYDDSRDRTQRANSSRQKYQQQNTSEV